MRRKYKCGFCGGLFPHFQDVLQHLSERHREQLARSIADYIAARLPHEAPVRSRPHLRLLLERVGALSVVHERPGLNPERVAELAARELSKHVGARAGVPVSRVAWGLGFRGGNGWLAPRLADALSAVGEVVDAGGRRWRFEGVEERCGGWTLVFRRVG